MSFVVALIVAGLVLHFWREVLVLIALVIITLALLGAMTVMHQTRDSAAAASGSSSILPGVDSP